MIKLIAAVSKNGVIGRDNDLIFKDKEDMKHFKETTIGKGDNVVVMGRKTWDSIPEAYRPFKDRSNVVITNNSDLLTTQWGNPYVDLDTVLEYLQEFSEKDTFIIGGGQIYEQMMPHADELIISEFYEEAEGDTFFPEIDLDKWVLDSTDYRTNFAIKTYKRR